MNTTPPVIGPERATANQRASWAMWDRSLLRGDCDVVPPLDPRVPVLVRARECVRRLREESK
jgi:hypothetical protein